jgi:1,4-alpha-glucan branching enzyme
MKLRRAQMPHSDFHFSITCHTDDKAVMFCLRSLAHYSEHHAQKNIAWGGTNDSTWERQNHTITLRFTRPDYRQTFRVKAAELLGGRWKEVAASDDNPAVPRNV